jgi:hypothetical protein
MDQSALCGDSTTSIAQGLSGGETIVRSGVAALKDGQKVRVVEG